MESENMLLKGVQFELHSPFCYYSLALIHLSNHNIGKAICFLDIFLKLKVFFFKFYLKKIFHY